MCLFVSLSATFSKHVARAFFQHVVAHYGLPCHIISERDPRFTGQFWRALIKEMKTELHFSTAFCPQSDGLVEVSNHILEQLL